MEEMDDGGGPGAPDIPGHDVVRPLGRGAGASVWLVQPHRGGPALAAKCFPAGFGAAPGGGDQLEREWRILSGLEHEHLVRVHGVVPLPGGGTAVLMDYAAGGSLRGLVAAAGPLSVGRAVTVLTPLAQALSFLHGQGIVHGDVSPANVLLTAQGKPVLADLGLGRVAGERHVSGGGTAGFAADADAVATARSDVYAAAAVGWFALTGRVPEPTPERPPLPAIIPDVPAELAAALEAGLSADPALRPTAAALAQAVYRSARAEALDLAAVVHPSVLPDLPTRRPQPAHGTGLPGRKPRGSRRRGAGRHRRAWVRAVVVLGTIAAAGVVLAAVLWPNPTPAPPPTAPPAAAGKQLAVPAAVRANLASADPGVALGALAWLRSYALQTGQFGLLDSVNAAGSPAMAADKDLAARLAKSGHGYNGLDTTVEHAVVVGPTGGGTAMVTVQATIVTGPYAEQDAAGAVVYSQPGPQKHPLRFVLARDGTGWRIHDIREAAK
ncbi:serine/threonine-protein kinase [Specibacter cremeus]|uniref:serine/threonine-protein kinase n=1 Tax=Specibacter cremeus TaxID=1629051 RepID=UPI000F79C2C6|nr:serine/threonine-protein kinase [Specibacter cremeus]